MSETEDDDGPTTDSPLTRWDYTNDLITGIIVVWGLGIVTLYLYAVANGQANPPSLSPSSPISLGIAFFIAMMAFWLYGRDAFEAVKSLWK